MAGIISAHDQQGLRPPSGRASGWLAARFGPERLRRWQHQLDFVRTVVWGQFRAEYDQYFLGWLWWILEPIFYAITFLFLVYVFFPGFHGDRLWIILTSVIVWKWFSHPVTAAPALLRQFSPYLRTGGVSLELLFVTFLVKETVTFFVALAVILVPLALFASPFSWHLLELPLVLLCQGLVVYWASVVVLMAGALVHDVGRVVGLIVSIWFYFSPGLYVRQDVQHFPPWLYSLLVLNPFWAILSSWQNILVLGQPADLPGLAVWTAVALVGSIVCGALLHRWRRTLIRKVVAE